MPILQRTRRLYAAYTLAFLLAISAFATAEKAAQLKPTNYVNDFAGVLDSETEARLNAMCLEVQQKANAQIAVVTIKSLEDESVEDFAVTLFKQWGIGAKGSDRGVLLLLATEDHKYRVEVGYGLEAILPDGKVGGFGREMVPLLRQNDFDGAITLMTTRIAQTIATDANVEITGAGRAPRGRQETPIPRWLLAIVIFALVVLVMRHPSLLIWFLFSGGGGGGSGGGFGGGGGGGFGGFGGGSSGGGGASGSW